MKKIYIASALVALLAAATSCDKYDIYPEQYGKVLMIKDAGERSVQIYATEVAAPYYVSVMKNGHTPEDPAQATLKVLNDAEFGEYKELYYGSKDFQGLAPLKPEFYYLADVDTAAAENNTINHTFATADDRYFGAYVVFNAQAISDWLADLENRARDNNKNKNPQEWQAANDTLNNYTFVAPIGLYSVNKNDSINADSRYLMLTPVVENPVVNVNVSNDAVFLVDQTRSLLKDEESAYRNDSIEPQIIFSIPCPNPYGFQIKYNNNPDTDIKRFNDHHTDMVLTKLPLKGADGGANFTTGRLAATIEFPVGVTEVRLPFKFARKRIDYNDMEHNYVTSVQLSKFNWPDKNTPTKIKNSLKLPQSELTWKDGNGVEQKYDGYTFFVGYRDVEEPMDLDEGCVLGANDPELTEGSFGALFDDDLSTFYHSAWSANSLKERQAPYGSYIDFEMPTKEPINAVAIKFTARVHSNPHSPKLVSLFYSNEDNEAERNANWKEICIEKEVPGVGKNQAASGQVTWLGGIKNDSEWIKAPEPFRYLRMSVVKNNLDESLYSIGSAAAGYWNLAELRMYGTVIE